MTTLIPDPRIQRVRTSDPHAVVPIGGVFIRIRYNVEDTICKRPDMTDAELLEANERRGGFAWLHDQKEDIYNDL